MGYSAEDSMVECHSLSPTELTRFLDRHKATFTLKTEIDLDNILREILRKANEFVPSESGSILLDDPYRKVQNRESNDLVFIATFGPGSDGLLNTRLSASKGIAGRVYQTGRSYLSEDVNRADLLGPPTSTARSSFRRSERTWDSRRTRSSAFRSTSARTSAVSWSSSTGMRAESSHDVT